MPFMMCNFYQQWYQVSLFCVFFISSAFPTSLYNASILSDMLYEKHLEVLYEAVSQCESLKDAIPLLKVWLSQQNLTEVMLLSLQL